MVYADSSHDLEFDLFLAASSSSMNDDFPGSLARSLAESWRVSLCDTHNCIIAWSYSLNNGTTF